MMTSLNQGYLKSKNRLELGCMKMELGHIHPMSKMISTNHLTNYLMPRSSHRNFIVFFLSKHQFDDVGGEHLKIVPFITKSLLCSTKVGGFNIIMLDVIVI
jgi:hypothetical protein